MCSVPLRVLLQVLGSRARKPCRPEGPKSCVADVQTSSPRWGMGHGLLILHVVCFLPERDEQQVEVCETKNEMGFYV